MDLLKGDKEVDEEGEREGEERFEGDDVKHFSESFVKSDGSLELLASGLFFMFSSFCEKSDLVFMGKSVR